MKTVLTLLLTMTLFPMLAFGQQGMFQYIEEREANLTSSQTTLLENIQNRKQTMNTWLVNIETDVIDLGTREQLYLNLPDQQTVEVIKRSIKTIRDEQVYWTGEMEEEISEVSLLITKEGITGAIRTQNSYFDISPFRDTGLHYWYKLTSLNLKKNRHR